MIIDDLTPTISDTMSDEIPVEQGTATLKTTWQKGLNLFASGAGTPQMNGTASTGSANALSRSDHIHPTDTSRASQTDMTAVQTGKADKADFKAITATLSTASWSSNQQTVSDAAFLASGYAYVVAPASSSFVAYGEAQVYADDVSTDGSMVFHCVTVPSSALTVNIMRMVAT